MNGALRTALLAALSVATLALAVGCGSPESDPTEESGGSLEIDESPGTASPADAGNSTETEATGDAPPAEPSRFAPGGPIADADLGKYHVTMSVSVDGKDVGTMTFAMWTEAAPITTRNFMRLCDEGFYDGIVFHRILRNFMVQGGDPTGTGGGNSPYGKIVGEMTDEPDRDHGYGVLSMARFGNDMDSASSQFFLCCEESPSVWGLDGKYSSFGKMTSGVATLEAIADVPVRPNGGMEISSPTKRVEITKAAVAEGPAPTGETIERPLPAPDLRGEPERVVVQHILIACQGSQIAGVMRTKDAADALANRLLAEARDGADMDALVREHSDDFQFEGDTTPGQYTLLNNGVRDWKREKASQRLRQDFGAYINDLQSKVMKGEMTEETYIEKGRARRSEYYRELDAVNVMTRASTSPAFGNVAFSLEVGEFGLAPFDPTSSPYGYHVVKRIE